MVVSRFSDATLIAAKDHASEAVRRLRTKLMQHYGAVTNSFKPDNTVVTELDGWAETEIKKSLKSFDSTIGFLGEEHGAEGDTQVRWLIDPIDGTEQFIRGIPFCGTMLCLVEGKDLLVSVIYNFVTNELYWAVKGNGAWLEDKRLHVSRRTLERSSIEITTDIKTPEGRDLYIATRGAVKDAVRYACSSFTSCLIATGAIEGRIVTHGRGGPWDYAPGALLIKEAGGIVVHIDGSEYDYTNTLSCIAGTSALVEFATGFSS